jgi:predicted AlkP superfamily phosphohydrolase/phosphomutase
MGIDGGTWDVLRPLMEEGKLPHLSGLVEKGSSGILKSTIPPETASAWTAFQTGVNSGKHGIYDFFHYIPGEYNPSVINSRKIPLETIWQILSRQGKKIIVVNLPVTYPAYPVNGLMLTCLLTPSVKSNFTYPPELAEEVLKIEKDYTIATTQQAFNRSSLEEFVETLISTEDKRTRVMLYLLDKHEWDVAVIHFHSSDPLQHAVYWYLDKNSPYFDPEKYEIAQRFYRAVDDNIGRLLKALPPDTLKIVLSDHGFSSVYKTININNFLVQNKFMTLQDKGFFNRRIVPLARLLRQIDKKYFRSRVSFGKRASIKDKLRLDKFIDWSKTQAFVINGWLYGYIYLNCIGREGRGIVHLGKEYEKLRNSIMEKLAVLQDPENGKRVIQTIYKKEDIYHGEFLNRAPDLIVVPEDGYMFSRTLIEKTSHLIVENRIKKDHTGTHAREGLFIFEGKMVDPKQTLQTADIIDILPTILYFFDIKIPQYMDGRVLTEVFSKDLRDQRTPQFEELRTKKHSPQDEAGDYEQDKKEIEKRLKELGYI